MTQTEFIEEEFQFLQHIKETKAYQRMIFLSKEIDADQELIALSKERDQFFLLADKEENQEKKREYLIQFNQKDEELKNRPIMKEYMILYESMQSLLRELSKQFTKEVKE